jgi:hypothetical protein
VKLDGVAVPCAEPNITAPTSLGYLESPGIIKYPFFTESFSCSFPLPSVFEGPHVDRNMTTVHIYSLGSSRQMHISEYSYGDLGAKKPIPRFDVATGGWI